MALPGTPANQTIGMTRGLAGLRHLQGFIPAARCSVAAGLAACGFVVGDFKAASVVEVTARSVDFAAGVLVGAGLAGGTAEG